MLSILICTKDGQSFISRQIDFIFDSMSNTSIPFELLIYDDGSLVPIIIDKNFSNIKLFRGEINIGLIAARNTLIKNVSKESEWIAFIDDDIFLFNMHLAFGEAIRAFRGDEKLGVISIPFVNLPLPSGYGVRRFGFIYDLNPKNHKIPYFFGGCSIHRKHNFELAGLFEERFFFSLEEEEMCFRLWKIGRYCILLDWINSIGVHDQYLNKNWSDRYVYLLSNRLLFYRKNISSNAIFFCLALIYLVGYLFKTRSFSIVKIAVARYLTLKSFFKPSSESIKFLRFLLFRNLHANL